MPNQSGYVKGRFIGEAARSILDVMDFTKKENIPGILLFIGFEKAFDSVDWNCMLKCLNVFGFGPNLVRWLETFYRNISSYVLNNGTCTSYFELQRGVRQGDPLSPHLFIIAAEILAIAIRSKPNIQGLKIGQDEFKLVQYADDLTMFVSDLECAQRVFRLLDQFESRSGLKVNYSKTEAMWIGSSRQNTETPLGLKWCNSVKALGIVFTYNEVDLLQKNFYDKLKDIRMQTRLWSCRGLSLYGKVTIIKSLLIPKMLYVFSIPPTPEDFIKQLNSIIYNFLRKGPDKIARLATINDLKHGGLDLIDIETSVKVSRLAWIGRLFSEGSLPWKAYINHLLEDFEGKFLFRCNYDVKDYKTYSKSYNELLQWWADFRASFSTKPPVSESLIWNNKNIKIDGKPIYYPNYVKTGILFCHHLQFDKDNLQSYNNAIGVGLRNTNFLVWTGVRSAIPAHLKALYSIEKESGVLEFFCGEKIFNPVTSKSKQFYHLLVSEKAKPSRGFKKLKEDFDLDDSSVANAFLNIKSLSSETFIRSFQFKILGDITYTNYRLAKIGYVPNDLCTFCEAGSETIHHLFYECSFVLFVRLGQKRFITYFMNALFQISFGNILKISGIHSLVSVRISL